MIHDYTRVGSPVAFGETRVGVPDLDPIHVAATLNLLDQVKKSKPRIRHNVSLRDSEVAFALRFASYDEFELDARTIYLGVRATHQVVTNTWGLGIGIRSQTDSDRESSKYVKYSFEVRDPEEVLVAKKEAYLLRSQTILEISDEGDIYNQIVSERKMYERQVTPEDCVQIERLLVRAAKRAAVC